MVPLPGERRRQQGGVLDPVAQYAKDEDVLALPGGPGSPQPAAAPFGQQAFQAGEGEFGRQRLAALAQAPVNFGGEGQFAQDVLEQVFAARS